MSTAQSQADAYDEVPYDSGPFSYTHPDSLATVAALCGMTPPAIDRCRVLEIGCAEGGNLIPMALGLPDGQFLGIDLSPRQIADGQRVIDQLGLPNIVLRVADLMDVDRSFGEFDYIVCHGVYSWVPRPVQDKILAICSAHLAPQGVAYVSYNTYPGWYSRGMVRDMVRYHVESSAPALDRVRQAREFVDFLVRNSRNPNSVYSFVLQEEQRLWQKSSDSYLLHEQLAEVNEPLYFHQFVGRLADHRLQFIAESKLSESAASPPEEVRDYLAGCRDNFVRCEQHLDFLRERTFRRSLICHEHISLDRSPAPEIVEMFLFAARAIPAGSEPHAASSSVEQFRTKDGISFSTNNPWLKAALIGLFDLWPRLLSFDELCRQARFLLGATEAAQLDPQIDAGLLKQPLLQCGMSGLVEIHLHRSPDVAEISNAPRASPLARLQAQRSPHVTSWRHRQIELNEMDRRILLWLDGRHTQDALLSMLSTLIDSGELSVDPNPTTSRNDMLRSLLSETLRRFAGGGLLDG